MEVILTQEEIEQKCKEWQKILGLSDWYVKPKIKRATEFAMENKAAEISWTLSRREAAMSILDPVDYPPACIVPQDMEFDIVHELIHLHIAPFDETKRDSMEETMMETAINALSKALLKVKRAGNQ